MFIIAHSVTVNPASQRTLWQLRERWHVKFILIGGWHPFLGFCIFFSAALDFGVSDFEIGDSISLLCVVEAFHKLVVTLCWLSLILCDFSKSVVALLDAFRFREHFGCFDSSVKGVISWLVVLVPRCLLPFESCFFDDGTAFFTFGVVRNHFKVCFNLGFQLVVWWSWLILFACVILLACSWCNSVSFGPSSSLPEVWWPIMWYVILGSWHPLRIFDVLIYEISVVSFRRKNSFTLRGYSIC